MEKSSGDQEANKVIEKLLSVRGLKVHKSVNLTETEIKNLLSKAIEIFMSQPIVLELEAPIKVVGIFLMFRRHPRAVLRSAETVRTRRFPPGC
jgi:hypothetical protein